MNQSYAESSASERKFTTREMVLVGMFAAVLAVISQISLPMPTGVPITIQVFGVALVGAVLGSRLGTTATVVYVLLGAIGLPIFANFTGGISSIVGVTGGYIWAWPFMTWLSGIRPKTDNKTKNLAISIGFSLIGLLIVETIGGLQWHFVGGSMSIPAIAVYSSITCHSDPKRNQQCRKQIRNNMLRFTASDLIKKDDAGITIPALI